MKRFEFTVRGNYSTLFTAIELSDGNFVVVWNDNYGGGITGRSYSSDEIKRYITGGSWTITKKLQGDLSEFERKVELSDRFKAKNTATDSIYTLRKHNDEYIIMWNNEYGLDCVVYSEKDVKDLILTDAWRII